MRVGKLKKCKHPTRYLSPSPPLLPSQVELPSCGLHHRDYNQTFTGCVCPRARDFCRNSLLLLRSHGCRGCPRSAGALSQTLWPNSWHQSREARAPARTQQRDVMPQPRQRVWNSAHQEWTEGEEAPGISEEEIGEPGADCTGE